MRGHSALCLVLIIVCVPLAGCVSPQEEVQRGSPEPYDWFAEEIPPYDPATPSPTPSPAASPTPNNTTAPSGGNGTATNNTTGPSPSPSANTTSPTPTTPAPRPVRIGAAVLIGGNVSGSYADYDPEPVRIRKGQAVVWKNVDNVRHGATSEDGLFDTGILHPDDRSAPVVFDTPGEYEYFCWVHYKTMNGAWIIVEA